MAQAAGTRRSSAILSFQFGRIVGYSMLGALAAASMQGLGWLTVQSAALRPVWSLFHVGAMALGAVLIWRAQQPIWLERMGRSLWNVARRTGARAGGAPIALGVLWALLPCGLLYSALLVAAMAGSALDGGIVMALFAFGTSLSMTLGPWLWLRLSNGRSVNGRSGALGIRIAGAALLASSGWALWMGLVHNTAPWCAT
jgi:sulfite exporter TauE/SafE